MKFVLDSWPGDVTVTLFMFPDILAILVMVFLSQMLPSLKMLVFLLWGWQFMFCILVLVLEDFQFLRNCILDLGVGVWCRLDG